MKRLCLIGAVLALLLVTLALPVQADEPAKYNFASAQGSKELNAMPGGECVGYIYFYNIDGNRITHITLTAGEAPSGWEVTVEPLLTETQVLVSGMEVMVEENLYVEPSELLIDEPTTIPEGMVSIKVPGRGYALGKVAQVVISVPESAPLGSTGEITIAGEAAWLGQSGAAAIKQARDFDFSVTVVSGSTEYSEEIIGQGEELPGAEGGNVAETDVEQGTQLPEQLSPESEADGFSIMKWLPVIIATVIVILGLILVPQLVRKRRQ